MVLFLFVAGAWATEPWFAPAADVKLAGFTYTVPGVGPVRLVEGGALEGLAGTWKADNDTLVLVGGSFEASLDGYATYRRGDVVAVASPQQAWLCGETPQKAPGTYWFLISDAGGGDVMVEDWGETWSDPEVGPAMVVRGEPAEPVEGHNRVLYRPGFQGPASSLSGLSFRLGKMELEEKADLPALVVVEVGKR